MSISNAALLSKLIVEWLSRRRFPAGMTAAATVASVGGRIGPPAPMRMQLAM